MYFYESFADDFDSKMNMYDTNKRVEVFFNELLVEDISGKILLDAGCGTGWFSKAAVERGANVTSMDLGENLLGKVKEKCNSTRVVGSILEMPFEDNFFDIVVSSEVIEHTPDLEKAIREIYRVLKPGGIMILSTPNHFWIWSLKLAELFKLRPYQGLENWTSKNKMKKYLNKSGFKNIELRGIHLFPFVFSFTYPLLNFFHRFSKPFFGIMVNIAVRANK